VNLYPQDNLLLLRPLAPSNTISESFRRWNQNWSMCQ